MPSTLTTNEPPEEQSVKNRQLKWLIGVLLFISVMGVAGRLYFLGPETLSSGDQLWRLSITANINSIPQDTEVKIYPPLDTNNIRTIEGNLSYHGFKTRKSKSDEKYQRSIHLIATDKGKQVIFADYVFHLSQTEFTSASKNIELTTDKRESLLLDNNKLQYKSYTVNKIFKNILSQQPDQTLLVDNIYSVAKSIPISIGRDAANVPEILTRNKATIYDRVLVMVSLSRAAGIPARLVSGLILKDDINPRPHYWVEVYLDKQWLSYDVYYGYKKMVPINYLPLRFSSNQIVEIKNGNLIKLEFDIEQEFNHPYLRKKQKYFTSSILNLSRLPLDIRNELALLLLLPLGALVTALFRHLVGVHSYGVFTPTLLALALVYANLMTTAIIFLVVTMLAIGGRSIFPSSLTRIPRLSIIFTLVAIILTLSVSVLNYYDIDQGGKIILLPIIILTSLVDRFYRTIEDRGLTIALKRLVWTIIIAFFCLPVIQFKTLGNFILQYPEIHFTTLALFVLISFYNGKHLIHLPFVKWLAEPEAAEKIKKSPNQNAS